MTHTQTIIAIDIIQSAALIAMIYSTWRNHRSWSATADAIEQSRQYAWEHLLALRDNCFITNELGHSVRYSKASKELREKAEQSAKKMDRAT